MFEGTISTQNGKVKVEFDLSHILGSMQAPGGIDVSIEPGDFWSTPCEGEIAGVVRIEVRWPQQPVDF